MQRYRDRLPVVAAALLVAATILLVVGTTIERSQASAAQHQQTNPIERPAGEAGETVEHREGEATKGEANTTEEGTEEHGSASESGEELFGINPESAGLTAAVAVLSLLLAALLVAWPRKGYWSQWSWLGWCSPPWMVVRSSTRPRSPTLGSW